MVDEDDLTPEEQFAVHINQAMAIAVQNDADPDMVAKICLNTAREMYDHYGAGGEHGNYLEFVTSAGFEAAEIEEWLDVVEGRALFDEDE